MKKALPILLLSLALLNSVQVFAQCEPVLSYSINWAGLPTCWSFPNGNAGIGSNGFGGQSGGAFIRSRQLINLQGTYSISTRTITNVTSGFTLQLVQNNTVVQSFAVSVSPGNFKTQTFQFNVAGSGYIQIAQLTTNAPFIALGNMTFTGVCPSNAAVEAKAKDITISLNANGTASITAGDLDDGSGDICGNSVTLSIDKSSFTCDDLGSNSISFTATRGDGETDTTTATVTVEPALALSSSTIFLDESGNASYTVEELLGSSSTNCSEISYSIDRLDFSCSDMSSQQAVIVTASYGASTSSKTLYVNVQDTIAPTAIARDLTIQLDPVTGTASITPEMVNNGSSDNCATNISLSKTQFSCADFGENEVTLTVTDNKANSSTATAIITITFAMAEVTVTSTNSHFCPDGSISTISIGSSVVGVDYYLRKSLNNEIISGPIAGTGSALDFSTGNIDSTTTFNVFATTNFALTNNSALDFDGVNDKIVTTYIPPATNTLTVEMWAKPTSTGPTRLLSSYRGGSTLLSGEIILDTYYAGSGDNGRALRFIVSGVGNAQFTYGVQNVLTLNEWNHVAATFNNGVIKLYVNGVLKGTSSTAPFTSLPLGTANVNIGEDRIEGSFGEYFKGQMDEIRIWHTARNESELLASMDDCLTGSETGLDLYYQLNESSGLVATNLVGGNNGTLTNMDATTDWVTSGVDMNCSYVCDFQLTTEIKIGDNTAPTPTAQNITLSLDGDGQVVLNAASLDNGSTDNCSAVEDLTFSVDQDIFSCADLGENTVTFKVMDASGNHATTSVVVTILDPVVPTVVSQNITASLDASGSVTITASEINNGSQDNCTSSENLVMSLDKTTFTCADLGVNMVKLTVADSQGNEASATATVTVVDNLAPSVITQNVTLQLSTSGTATLLTTDVNNGSSDNCTAQNELLFSLGQTDFTCAHLGANTVTLSGTDANGNTGTGTATVTVVDAIAPTALARDISVRLDINNQASITGADVNNGSVDNCSSLTFAMDKSSFNETNLGPNPVTLTVTDGSGNTSSASATVTILKYKPQQTITFGTLSNITYGAAPITLTASASSSLEVAFSLVSGPATLTGNTLSITGAGTISVKASQSGNNDYLPAEDVLQNFEVNKAALQAVADNKEIPYGNPLPELTISYIGLVNGDEASRLDTPPTIATSAGNQEGFTPPGSYEITLNGGASANYDFQLANAILTVSKANLTVTADDQSIVFGDALPALTFSYQGFAQGENELSLTSAPAISTTATATSDVGEYAIELSGGEAANYAFTLNSGTLTISPAPLSAEELTHEVKVYPNPSTDLINIQMDSEVEVKIVLYNHTGTQVLHYNLQGSTHQIDITSLPAGMYLLFIHGQGTEQTHWQKIVVKR